MLTAAFAVALPVAWIYTSTRAKRGYQQSVVQLLIILPVVVAGILVMVKYSITLAFSLGGIAAAVRFRNSLDDQQGRGLRLSRDRHRHGGGRRSDR